MCAFRPVRTLAGALCLAAALAANGAAAESAPENALRDALRSGDLICDFPTGFAHALLADLGRRPARRAMMLFYEAIDPVQQRARVVSTHSAGRKPVITRSTPRAVHLIEAQGASVRVTALTACTDWRVRRGIETCVRFSARHVWHFDAAVLADPDASYARQARGAIEGSCEPWILD